MSAALTSHMTCLDSLRERNSFVPVDAEIVTVSLRNALALYALPRNESGLLASWEAAAWRADFVVAKDGSGNYKTINEAVAALALRGRSSSSRVVIYVKSGVYPENVEIRWGLKNVMFVGDGIDKTIVTSNRNVPDGATTFGSATFAKHFINNECLGEIVILHGKNGVSADGFWARDMTFENTAGPAKHQAVALRVGSDLSVFYRCSFRGYQDTLFVLSPKGNSIAIVKSMAPLISSLAMLRLSCKTVTSM
ncbi:hypothetical protein AAC387_Pa08g0391 [Persea americana]